MSDPILDILRNSSKFKIKKTKIPPKPKKPNGKASPRPFILPNKNYDPKKAQYRTLTDSITAEYLLGNLDQLKTYNFLKNSTKSMKNKLLVANVYATYKGDREVYSYLSDDKSNLQGFSAFIAVALKDEIKKFARGLYGVNDLPRDSPADCMIQDIVTTILDYDLKRYYQKIESTYQYGLLAICNNIMLLPKACSDSKHLFPNVPDKINQLEKSLAEKNILPSRGLSGLSRISNIPYLSDR